MPSLYLQLWLCRVRLNIVTNEFIGIWKRVMFIEKNIPVVKIARAIAPPYIKTRVWHDRHPETRSNLRWKTEDKSKKIILIQFTSALVGCCVRWSGRLNRERGVRLPSISTLLVKNIAFCFLNKIFNNTQSDCPASPPCWIQNQASGY